MQAENHWLVSILVQDRLSPAVNSNTTSLASQSFNIHSFSWPFISVLSLGIFRTGWHPHQIKAKRAKRRERLFFVQINNAFMFRTKLNLNCNRIKNQLQSCKFRNSPLINFSHRINTDNMKKNTINQKSAAGPKSGLMLIVAALL